MFRRYFSLFFECVNSYIVNTQWTALEWLAEIALEDMPNLRYRTFAERKTNSGRGGSKLWQEYNIIFDGIVSMRCMSWPFLEHAPSIRRIDTNLPIQSHTRRIHESQCSYQLTSKRTRDEVRGYFSMYTFAAQDNDVAFGQHFMCVPYGVLPSFSFRFHFTSHSFSNYLYLFTRTNVLDVRKYRINGKLELATDPLQCYTMPHRTQTAKQRND